KSAVLTPGGQGPDGAARGGVHTGYQVAPLVAVLHRGDGALAGAAPDLGQKRVQAAALLIRGPDLPAGDGVGGGQLTAQLTPPLVTASCSAGSALTWRGRRRGSPRRRRYAQPVPEGTVRPSRALSHSATVRPVPRAPCAAGPRSASRRARGTRGRA